MKTNKNIKIIGTTHLTKKEEIIKQIKKFNPDIIGVELCNIRFEILVNQRMGQIQAADGAMVQANPNDSSLMGKISSSIADKAKDEGMEYGGDMISAARYAKENQIPILLVDRDIVKTRNLMERIPEAEQKQFMAELTNFEAQTLKENVSGLNEDDITAELQARCPVAYEFLVEERDMFIENMIMKAMIEYPKKKMLIFLGKVHANKISKDLNTDVYITPENC